MTPEELRPIAAAIRGAIALGVVRPVVLILFSTSDKADDVHQSLKGSSMPPLPPRPDGDPPIYCVIESRERTAVALRACCGGPGEWAARQLLDDDVSLDGHLAIVQPDRVAWGGVRGGRIVAEGMSRFDTTGSGFVSGGAVERGRTPRPGRPRRRGR